MAERIPTEEVERLVGFHRPVGALAADLLDARRALDEFHASPALAHAHADLAAAKTKNERLREALERVAPWLDYLADKVAPDWSPNEAAVVTADRDFARAALSGEET